MQGFTLFVADPEIVPECESSIALAREYDVPIRKIEPGSIDQIQEQFGDAFPGVPALYAEGQTPAFSVGVSAVARKLRAGGAPAQAQPRNELPPIPPKDKPDGAVRN